MIFKRKNIPENYYEVLPEDFKQSKYRKVSKTEYFAIRDGYSYRILQEGKKLMLTKSGVSMTGSYGLGILTQGFKKEKQGTESTVVELTNK